MRRHSRSTPACMSGARSASGSLAHERACRCGRETATRPTDPTMSHALVMALFSEPSSAAAAARDLRALGIARERVSIVARSHDDEGFVADAADASPGSEIEDSRPASRLGELAAHLAAVVSVVIPGVGPIVADGPLA